MFNTRNPPTEAEHSIFWNHFSHSEIKIVFGEDNNVILNTY